jgi:lysyl-tRNA synthetase class II
MKNDQVMASTYQSLTLNLEAAIKNVILTQAQTISQSLPEPVVASKSLSEKEQRIQQRLVQSIINTLKSINLKVLQKMNYWLS